MPAALAAVTEWSCCYDWRHVCCWGQCL